MVLHWLAVRGDAPGPLLCPVNKGKRVTLRRLTSQAVLFILQRRAPLGRRFAKFSSWRFADSADDSGCSGIGCFVSDGDSSQETGCDTKLQSNVESRAESH